MFDRNEIIKRLRYLQIEDQPCKIFGASRHRYNLLPPIEVAVFTNYELKQTIKFPDDFKEFYTQIGGGDAGPYYGLYTTLLDLTFIPSALLARKCLDIGIDFDHIDHDDIKGLTISNRAVKQLISAIGEEIALVKMLAIAEYGCGYYIYLILSGGDFGKVVSGVNYSEVEVDNRKVVYPDYEVIYNDFYSFYMDWLNQTLEHQLAILKNSK